MSGVDTPPLSLRRGTLVYPFTAGELVEALALYRELRLIVDPEGGFRSLFDRLTPAGFERLVAGESPESLSVGVKILGITGQGQSILGPRGSFYSAFADAMIEDNLFEWDYTVREKTLPYSVPGEHRIEVWKSDATKDVIERFFTELRPPEELVRAVLIDTHENPERFIRYCQLRGLPLPDILTIEWERAALGFSYMVRDGLAGDDGEQERLQQAFDEFVYATVDAYLGSREQQGHLILPPPASDMLWSDTEALTRRVIGGEAAREAVVAALLPDTPGIAQAVDRGNRGLSVLLDDLLRLREARLEIPEDLDHEPQELIRRLHKRAPWSGTRAKRARWLLFTGAGVMADAAGAGGAGTAAGVGLSAVDALLLERLVEQWRPDQYVPRYRRGLNRLTRRATH